MSLSRMVSIVAIVAVTAALGCDGYPHAPPATSPSSAPSRMTARLEPAPTAIPHPGLPKPDAARLHYDSTTRTLSISGPPIPGIRWMLGTPTEPRGIPIERAYQFPHSVDLDKVTVFFTATNGRSSSPVALREVIAAHEVK